jgi:hypothetical protein
LASENLDEIADDPSTELAAPPRGPLRALPKPEISTRVHEQTNETNETHTRKEADFEAVLETRVGAATAERAAMVCIVEGCWRSVEGGDGGGRAKKEDFVSRGGELALVL